VNQLLGVRYSISLEIYIATFNLLPPSVVWWRLLEGSSPTDVRLVSESWSVQGSEVWFSTFLPPIPVFTPVFVQTQTLHSAIIWYGPVLLSLIQPP